MKHLVFPFSLSLVLLLPSCAVFKVYTVDSSNVTFQPDGTYSYADDSVSLNYNFWNVSGKYSPIIDMSATNGSNGWVKAFLTNKTNKPLFIHWDKSYYVVNGVSYPYWEDTYQVSSSTSSSGISYKYLVRTGSQTSATVSRQSKTMPFAPKSELLATQFHLIDLAGQIRKKGNDPSSYSKQTSPLKFGISLAYSLGSATSDDIAYISNSFWITNLRQVPSTGSNRARALSSGLSDKEHKTHFYITQSKAGDTVLVVGCLIAAAAAAGIIIALLIIDG